MKRALDLTDSESESEDDEPIANLRKKQKIETTSTAKQPAKWPIGYGSGALKFKTISPDKNFWFVICEGDKPSSKIAAFDMDWTILNPKGGKKTFPKKGQERQDWEWWPNGRTIVKAKLRKLHSEGYRIVFITNQTRIEKNADMAKKIIGKITDVANNAGIPIFGMVCGGKNKYRKPFTTSWERFLEDHNKVKVDMKASFFVGDAAGRAKNWNGAKIKKDFNCSDRKFAANIGLPFHTPDEYFLGEKKAKFDWGKEPDPKTILDDIPAPVSVRAGTSKELVIMVGFPGSGKSTIAKSVLKNYEWVNQDALKTKPKCVKVCKAAMEAGKSVVIDNTNRDGATRKLYLDLARKYGYSARCFWITNGPLQDGKKGKKIPCQKDFDLARHLNVYRTRMINLRPVPAVGFYGFNNNFQVPTEGEGFTEVVKIPFSPQFANEKARQIFHQWMPHFR